MKRLFLAPLLLSIGLISPVKAEPEWIKYDSFFETDYFIDHVTLFVNG